MSDSADPVVRSDVDELFGSGAGAPTPRTGLVLSLLITGVAMTLVGLLCTSAPGGLLVLLAWNVVEKEVDRVETGYLPADTGKHVRTLQGLTYAGLVLVIIAFFLQGGLLCMGSYHTWWAGAAEYFLSPPGGI